MNKFKHLCAAALVVTAMDAFCVEFQVPLKISFSPDSSKTATPVTLMADFDRLSANRLAPDLVDPHSLKIARKKQDGTTEILPVQFDERLYYGNTGKVSWVVRNYQQSSEYSLLFDRRKNGSLRELPYMPAVGIGDELYAQAEK